MKEITLSRRNLFIFFLILLLTGGGIVLIQQFFPAPVAAEPTLSPEDASSAWAATAGAQAFYQIDVTESKTAWLDRFCALSSDNGCTLVRTGADLLWQKYQEAKTTVRADARALERISKTTNEQVWRVVIKLSEPLPGSNRTEAEAYVVTMRVGLNWKFDRFLLEEEVQALKKRATQVPVK